MATYSAAADRCDCHVIHQEIVARVQKKMPDEDSLSNLADLFKVFGDFTRIKIISALLFSQMCVCDIAVLLGMTKSAVSHQLRVLRQARLVKYRKDGKIVFYSLDDEHVSSILKQGFAHIGDKRK